MDYILNKSYTLTTLCVMLSLSGCGIASFTDTNLLVGEVNTTNGNYPIANSEKSRWEFYSSLESESISIRPFKRTNGPHVGSLEYSFSGEEKDYATFEPIFSFYQINKEPIVPIELDCNIQNVGSGDHTKIICNYPLPNILIAASYNHSAEGLRHSAEVSIKSSITNTYRFMMIFKHNDSPIAIDFTFRLKLTNKLRFGIPGGSP